MSSLGRPDILYEIHETHRLHEMHLNIRFIPAHKGIEGNEVADDLAKQAIRNDNIARMKLKQ